MVRISKKTDDTETVTDTAPKRKSSKKDMDFTGVTVISVTKAPAMKEGARVKNRPVLILMKLLCKVYPGIRMTENPTMLLAVAPKDVPAGDAARFREGALKYVFLLDSYSDEQDMKIVDKLIENAEKNGCMDAIGTSILTDYLARTYMEEFGYTVWTVE